MTAAYSTGVEITAQPRSGNMLASSIAKSPIRTEIRDDAYPEWHPASHSFLGMVRLLIYREITGDSYRALARYQELAEVFDYNHIPDKYVLSRTWRKRFDDGVREFVQIAAHFVVKGVHDRDFSAPSVRPKSEVVDEEYRSTEDDEAIGREFTDEQIYRTTRLAVLLYNIWRLTDFLLKAGVDGEIDYEPVLPAGECVELVCSALIPADYRSSSIQTVCG